MSQFTIYNDAGEVQYGFSCHDDEDAFQTAPAGLHLLKGEAGPRDQVDPVRKVIVRDVKPAKAPVQLPPAEAAYAAARRSAYPSIAMQLDMLWHAMDDGSFPKAEPFYGQIKAVKLKYPKAIDPKDKGRSITL